MLTTVIEDDSPKPWLKTNLIEDFQYLKLSNLSKMLDPCKYVAIAYERISKVGYVSLGYFFHQLDKEDLNSLCALIGAAGIELKGCQSGEKEYVDCNALQQVTLLVALLALGEGYGDSDSDWSELRLKFYQNLIKVLDKLTLGENVNYLELSLFS